MASPFTIIRKYQAVLMVVFLVIIMLVFTIGDAINKSSRTMNVTDPVVVTWSGGKLTRNQVLTMLELRQTAAGFLDALQQRSGQQRQASLFTTADLTPEATVHSMLLAAKAEQLGLTVTTTEINDYLDAVGGQKVSTKEMRDMIARTHNSVDTLIHGPLREELLARRLLIFVRSGLAAMPPASQFTWFSRLNEQIRAEVIAIPVDTFLGLVPDPSEGELKRYFDKYKDRLPPMDPDGTTLLLSSQPGFKLPHRIAVQYFKADWKDVVDRTRPSVSDKEIEEYYNENKDKDDQLQQQELPLIDLKHPPQKKDSPPKDAPGGPNDKSGNDKAGGPPSAAPSKSAPAKPDKAPATAPDKAPPPAKKDAAPEKKDGKADSPATALPATDGTKTKTPPEKTPGAGGDKAAPSSKSGAMRRSPATVLNGRAFVLFDQADGKAIPKPAADQPPGNPKTGNPKIVAPESSAAKAPTEKGPDQKGATEKGAGEKAPPPQLQTPPPDKVKPTPDSVKPTDDKLVDDKTPKPPKFKPLSEVKDYIQKSLAQQKAYEKLTDNFKILEGRMRSYREIREDARIQKKTGPAPLDFHELGKPFGMSAHTTELLSQRSFETESDVGKSLTNSGHPLAAVDFDAAGEPSLFRPIISRDDEFWYLSWKIKDEDERVPELSGDVRDAVIKQWKRGAGSERIDDKARGLAMVAANRLARQIEKGESPAKVVKSQPDARLIETNPFSWLTYGEARQSFMPPTGPPQLSKIDGIDEPGSGFMEAAFNLKPGEVGVAMNHPQTYVYVLKVISRTPSANLLLEDFLARMSTQLMRFDIEIAIMLEWQRLGDRLIASLEKEDGLTWVDRDALRKVQ